MNQWRNERVCVFPIIKKVLLEKQCSLTFSEDLLSTLLVHFILTTALGEGKTILSISQMSKLRFRYEKQICPRSLCWRVTQPTFEYEQFSSRGCAPTSLPIAVLDWSSRPEAEQVWEPLTQTLYRVWWPIIQQWSMSICRWRIWDPCLAQCTPQHPPTQKHHQI